jgi:murein DD-endopeptidase MepM/ murein hydrolase activator NlpD
MQKVRNFVKKAFTPVTIMLIPHSDARPLRVKSPSIGIVASLTLSIAGIVYLFSIAIHVPEYNRMKEQLRYYSEQFSEVRATIESLKKAETEFTRLFSLGSREGVLEHLDSSDRGSIDLEGLKDQIKATMETTGEIKDYLSKQKDIYLATPKGWPVDGHMTSPFGNRENPVSGKAEFHSGVDIAAEAGKPVRATADGIVIFAGWSGTNGNLVVLQHGFGFSTFYAHNKIVAVKVGQKVKRGDVMSYLGSTGNSTGPHVHYEVWRSGKPVNPDKYLEGRA